MADKQMIGKHLGMGDFGNNIQVASLSKKEKEELKERILMVIGSMGIEDT